MISISFGAASMGGGTRGKGRAILGACLGLLLLAVGAATLAQVPWAQVATHIAARSWPVTDARIVSVSLSGTSNDGAEDASTPDEFILSVTYEYRVAGTQLTGHRAGLSDRADVDDRRLKRLYRKLNFAQVTGRTVPVAYDPQDPARAFLDISFPWKRAALRGGLGFALLAAGFAYLATTFRPIRARV